MTDTSPILMWFRRDLRLGDHAALSEAVGSGRPVVPVFVLDEVSERFGAAPKLRLGLSLAALGDDLAGKGSRLILRRGDALATLRALIAETGATAVYWSRLYDPDSRKRDEAVKAALKGDGVEAKSFAGHVMFEPWTVETQTGGLYRVYTPFWKAVRDRDVPASLPTPGAFPAPDTWPGTDDLDDWHLDAAMDRGAAIVAPHQVVGEAAASSRLAAFVANHIDHYKDRRDFPAEGVASGLSENLAWGEISPARAWHAGWRAVHDGKRGAEHFLKELVWREFAYHLVHHTPHITTRNWREEWDAFPWNDDERRAEVKAWKQGRTGIPFVDAAMRQMYVTGTMHNRARMIVASYLTKHLMCDWRIGQAWFEDCLTDWDPASNALGWQWVAGSGPDAAPYFRVFNPVSQVEKFDPDHAYLDAWIAEGRARPAATALSYFDAIPRRWTMAPDDAYPDPIVTHEAGRKAALDAYEARKF